MKELEKLREWLFNERECAIETLFERLEELNEFELGCYKGQIMMAGEVRDYIRNRLKYGDN